MSDDNGTIQEAIEKLEEAAEALEDAISSPPATELKAKLKRVLPRLRDAIGSLNEQYAGPHDQL
jgi:hypothetical protein